MHPYVHILSHTFKLPGLKPFSVNASYVRTFGGVAKSNGAREFCAQIFNHLHNQAAQEKLTALRALFDPQKHAYEVSITAYYPADEFYTKKGQISNKTIDMSNGEKLIIDCFFLPKFCSEPFPYGCQNLECDDRFINTLVSHKKVGATRAIEVCIKIVELVI